MNWENHGPGRIATGVPTSDSMLFRQIGLCSTSEFTVFDSELGFQCIKLVTN